MRRKKVGRGWSNMWEDEVLEEDVEKEEEEDKRRRRRKRSRR